MTVPGGHGRRIQGRVNIEHERGDRIDDDWPVTEHKPPPCPQCGRPAVPIVYGFPSPGLMEAADRGAVVLGGCVIEGDQPTYQCVAGHEWRAQPPG